MARSRKSVAGFAMVAALALAACGGGGTGATCNPGGTELHIAVPASQSHAFTTDCLAAPAGEPITIDFDNQDTSPHGNHNIHIFGSEDFIGDYAAHGTSILYEVGAFPAGTYRFRCDAHPSMKGAFIVK